MSPTDETLTSRTIRAGQWRLAGNSLGTLLQLAVGILLARVLTPADFGVMTLAYVVLGLSELLAELGIGAAVVQRTELTDRHVRSAFTFSVLLGVSVAAVISLLADVGASLMREARFTGVLRALAIGFAFRGAGVVASAMLRRRLEFRAQFFIETGSYLLGYVGVSVTMALLGYGVWSLVWGSIVQTLAASIAALAVVRHSVRPLLAWRELRELLRFGVGSHLNGCVNYVARNADNFVVGRWMGASHLGLYTRGYALMNLPYVAAAVMTSVLFPAYAEAQADPARLRRGYLIATRLTAMIAGPSMGTLAIVAPHLVPTLFGHQWTGVVGPLQTLCIAGYFRALYHLGGAVAQSVGRVYSELFRQCGYAALVIVGAIVGSRYGLSAVAAGVTVAIVYMFFATGQLALSITATSWRAYFRVQVGAVVTAAITCSAALLVRLALEAHVRSLYVTLAVLAAAAVPWTILSLWQLAGAEFESLRGALPGPFLRLAETLVPRPAARLP